MRILPTHPEDSSLGSAVLDVPRTFGRTLTVGHLVCCWENARLEAQAQQAKRRPCWFVNGLVGDLPHCWAQRGHIVYESSPSQGTLPDGTLILGNLAWLLETPHDYQPLQVYDPRAMTRVLRSWRGLRALAPITFTLQRLRHERLY